MKLHCPRLSQSSKKDLDLLPQLNSESESRYLPRRRPLALRVLFQASEISIGRLTVQYFNRLNQGAERKAHHIGQRHQQLKKAGFKPKMG